MKRIKSYFYEFRLLLKSVPSVVTSVFVVAIVAMNLLANKSININVNWLALDMGIIASWVVFLCMDVLTKHFGPRAATQISIFAMAVNLLLCLLFFVASKIGGTWGAFYDFGEQTVVNEALDSTFGGTWYVVMGSTVAFVASAVANNFLNFGIGKMFKRRPDGFGAYAMRTYVSTAIAQLIDNLIFALIVSHFFFGWSILECFTCAATGMVAELLVEAAFSPLGYVVCRRWAKEGVGKEYLDFVNNKSVKTEHTGN